ncbi:MAG: immunoglobulin domain-containing protein, partial [Verrucomicrobia bacterium]|nr:immunoglobulin domain-containing protein [Verrucomicrobiota bacterium]
WYEREGAAYAEWFTVDLVTGERTLINDVTSTAIKAYVWVESALAITAQPQSQVFTAGANVTFTVAAAGTPRLAYHWLKTGAALTDGGNISGALSPTLRLANVQPADAASYTCTVSNAAGAVTSAAAAVAVTSPSAVNPARLSNLAVRTTAGPGAPLIVGFVVGGAGTAGNKPLLLRGVGPSLGALGVAGALADPRLVLFHDGDPLASNDNWEGNAAVAALGARLGAFALEGASSKDAALAAFPDTGGYTVQIASGDATSGTALAEIYDASTAFSATEPRLVNVSARSEVGGANGALIAGFVVAGPVARTVLIRAVGPGLAQFGVKTALADPRLTLFRGGTVVAANDDWYGAPNAVAVAAAAVQVGAFRLPTTSADAGLLLTLPPGSYTAQVSGPEGATGSALVEVYEVP